MSNNTFNPGDVVVLKSGGPKMTYEYENANYEATCSYFINNERKRESFVYEALKLVDAD